MSLGSWEKTWKCSSGPRGEGVTGGKTGPERKRGPGSPSLRWAYVRVRAFPPGGQDPELPCAAGREGGRCRGNSGAPPVLRAWGSTSHRQGVLLPRITCASLRDWGPVSTLAGRPCSPGPSLCRVVSLLEAAGASVKGGHPVSFADPATGDMMAASDSGQGAGSPHHVGSEGHSVPEAFGHEGPDGSDSWPIQDSFEAL